MTESQTIYQATPPFGACAKQPSEPGAYQARDGDMEKYADAILAIIKSHVGHENAITARKIAEQLKLFGAYDDRKVRMIIRRIIEEKQETICSSDRGNPNGFFYPRNEQELLDNIQDIDGDIAGYRRNRDNLSRAGAKRFGGPVEQHRMAL